MTLAGAPPLQGRKVFILEDDGLISMMMESMVEELGGIVLAAHSHLVAARAFIEARHAEIDVAVLDLHLDGVRSYDVAHMLLSYGIPFIFSTGYDESVIESEWRKHPRIAKPFQLDELAAALRQVLSSITRAATPGDPAPIG